MNRTLLLSALALAALLAPGMTACGGNGGSEPQDTGKLVGDTGGEAVDIAARDAAVPDGAVPDEDAGRTPETADDLGLLPDDTAVPEGAVVKGRVIDSEEDPIPTPFLVLCGYVEGKDVCNNLKGEEDGTFAYVGLKSGYSHLQIMAFQAEMVTGLSYSGANIVVDVGSKQDVIDLGDVRIPIVTSLQEMASSQGGTMAMHGLELDVTADALLFPSGEELGKVGIEDVPPGDTPFSSAGVYKTFAFYPFASFLYPEGTLRIKLSEIAWAGAAPTEVTLLFNSMEDGGLSPIDFTVENGVMTTTLTDLTWIGLGDCGSFDIPGEKCVEL